MDFITLIVSCFCNKVSFFLWQHVLCFLRSLLLVHIRTKDTLSMCKSEPNISTPFWLSRSLQIHLVLPFPSVTVLNWGRVKRDYCLPSTHCFIFIIFSSNNNLIHQGFVSKFSDGQCTFTMSLGRHNNRQYKSSSLSVLDIA